MTRQISPGLIKNNINRAKLTSNNPESRITITTLFQMNTFSKLTLLQRIISKAGKKFTEKKIYEVILLYINLWGKENFRVTSLLVCENWARRLIFIKRVLYFQYFAINFQFADKLDNNLTPAPLVASFKINWLPLNKDVERLLMRFLHEYTCLVTWAKKE